MAQHLRRFVTSPLPIFEVEYATAAVGPPPLVAAAKCLALCIKVSHILGPLLTAEPAFSTPRELTSSCPTCIRC